MLWPKVLRSWMYRVPLLGFMPDSYSFRINNQVSPVSICCVSVHPTVHDNINYTIYIVKHGITEISSYTYVVHIALVR